MKKQITQSISTGIVDANGRTNNSGTRIDSNRADKNGGLDD